MIVLVFYEIHVKSLKYIYIYWWLWLKLFSEVQFIDLSIVNNFFCGHAVDWSVLVYGK